MKIKREKRFKRCPRCGFKTYNTFDVCGKCGLNYKKFDMATNYEGKDALKKGEKDRVIFTSKLPCDVNKWELLVLTIMLGWAGVHLWKVGRINRAICHLIGLVGFAIYAVIYIYEITNIFLWNLGNIMGAFWLVTFAFAIIDIIEIALNRFKVPVSLPYKEEK